MSPRASSSSRCPSFRLIETIRQKTRASAPLSKQLRRSSSRLGLSSHKGWDVRRKASCSEPRTPGHWRRHHWTMALLVLQLAALVDCPRLCGPQAWNLEEGEVRFRWAQLRSAREDSRNSQRLWASLSRWGAARNYSDGSRQWISDGRISRWPGTGSNRRMRAQGSPGSWCVRLSRRWRGGSPSPALPSPAPASL